MTRKFAVTLFATSLTLVGCGSTSTTKQDAAVAADGHAADVVAQNPDVVPTPDTAPVTPDTALVTPDTALVTPDTAPVTPDTAPPVDVARPADVAIPDGSPVVPDTRPDVVTPRPEAGRDVAIVDAPNTDAGVDAADAGDGSNVDGGTSDGGDGGQD
jgi:hypothetical protein